MGGRDRSVQQRGPLRPFLTFHVAAGGRLAFRAAIPAAAALAVACGLAPSPTAAMKSVASALAGPPVPAGAAVALVSALSLASWVARRAGVGATGWLAHLPAKAATRRRALALALVVGQAPLAILGAVAALALASPVAVARLAGMGVLLAGAAVVALPVRRRGWAGTFGFAAAALGAWGSLPTAALGLLSLVAADCVAGPLQQARAPVRLPLPLPVPALLALRAVASDLPGAWAAASLPLLAGAAFVRHNALPKAIEQGAVRLAGILALGVVIALISSALGAKRPVWAWMRSLPASSRRRILWDATVLAGIALPVLLGTAVVAGVTVRGWGAVALVLPWLALLGAAALRRKAGREGPLLAQAAFAAAWIALLWWLAALTPVLAALSLRTAVRRERALVAHAWDERGPVPDG